MGCSLNYAAIASMPIDCTSTSGGVVAVKYKTHGSASSVAFVDIGFNPSDKVSNYSEVLTNNDNGTTVVDQTLTISIAGINADVQSALDTLCNPNVKLILEVHFANGTKLKVGNEYGAVLSEVKLSTGANAGDSQGYMLTFKGEEPVHAPKIV